MSSQCQKIELKKLPFLASDITNFTSAVCAVVLDIFDDTSEPKFTTWADTYSADLYNSFLTVNSFSASWGSGDSSVFTFVYSNSANILNVNNNVNIFSANWNSVYESYNSLSAHFLTESDITTRFVNLSGDVMTGGLSAPSLSTDNLYVAGSTINFFDESGNIIETLKSNDVGNFKSNYTVTNSRSAKWEEVSTEFSSQSSNNSFVYNTVQSNSGEWNYQGTDIKSLTSNWENTYNEVFAYSADWNDTRSNVQTNSAQWATDSTIDTGVRQLTSNWENTYIQFASQSSNNLSVYNTVQSNSSTTWNYQGTDIKSLTSNWENVYNTVQVYSGDWNYQGTDIKQLTANWQNTYNFFSVQSANNVSVYNTVNSNSANWNYQGTDIKSLTANWESTYNSVNITSGSWNSVYNSFNSQSGNNFSVYNTVQTNSGDWNYQGTDIKSLTSNWESVYSSFNSQSSNNQSVYNIVNSNSASWINDAPQTLTFNSVNAELTISNGNTVNLSSLSGGSGSESDPIFTAWAQTYSANYQDTFNTVQSNSATTWNYQGTDIKSLTGNWEDTFTNFSIQSSNNTSVYTTVNTNSSTWGGGGGTPQTLSYSEPTSELSISDGNIISLSSLASNVAVLTSDFSTTDNTNLQNVVGLNFYMEANRSYYFECYVQYITNSTTTGSEIGITGPSSPSLIFSQGFICNSTAVENNDLSIVYGRVAANANSGGTTARNARVQGLIVNGPNAGDLYIQTKVENTVTGTLTYLSGSFLIWFALK